MDDYTSYLFGLTNIFGAGFLVLGMGGFSIIFSGALLISAITGLIVFLTFLIFLTIFDSELWHLDDLHPKRAEENRH